MGEAEFLACAFKHGHLKAYRSTWPYAVFRDYFGHWASAKVKQEAQVLAASDGFEISADFVQWVTEKQRAYSETKRAETTYSERASGTTGESARLLARFKPPKVKVRKQRNRSMRPQV